MKLNIKLLNVLFFFGILFFSSCLGIKEFRPNIHSTTNRVFVPYFDKDKIGILKTEWKELYLLLKKGHLLVLKSEDELSYISSFQLYQTIKFNTLKLYNTSFLQNYDNLIATFGLPTDERIIEGKIYIIYSRNIIDDPCQTCIHDLLGYTFDKETKKLLKE